jgi:hypothetical protein
MMNARATNTQTTNRTGNFALRKTSSVLISATCLAALLTVSINAAALDVTPHSSQLASVEYTAQAEVKGLESLEPVKQSGEQTPTIAPVPIVEPAPEPIAPATEPKKGLVLDFGTLETDAPKEPEPRPEPVPPAQPVPPPKATAKPEPPPAPEPAPEPPIKSVPKAEPDPSSVPAPAPGTETKPVTKTPPIPGSVRPGPAADEGLSVIALVGIAAGGLVILCAIGWLVMRRKGGASSESSNAKELQEVEIVPPPAPAPTPAPAPAPPPAPAPVVRPKTQTLASSTRPRAVLRDLTGTTEKTEHVLEADVIQIGRATAEPGSDIQSIVVKRKTVGRRHAVIEYRNHTYWLVDQGSLNGSLINGIRVDGEMALRPGAVITLESAEFEFTLPAMGETQGFEATQMAPALAGMLAAAPAAPASGAKLLSESPQNFLETMVNREAPPDGFKPAAPAAASIDAAADEDDATTPPASQKDVIAAATAAGTVDFDVFGDTDYDYSNAGDSNDGKSTDDDVSQPPGGLIDRYSRD